jgi:subtilisin family serine protease
VLLQSNYTVIPTWNFTSSLFHGASFELVNGTSELAKGIESLEDVEQIWPVGIIEPLEDPIEVAELPEVGRWDAHHFTRVRDVHDLGQQGDGILIAVIDSGIDYNHPALGGGFGIGFKVEKGWDFVGPNYHPDRPGSLSPGPDPRDCSGHGTHVAGIAASEDKDWPGVAPKARLAAYKVFGCQGGAPYDILMQAFIRAFDHGADIITASIRSDDGFAGNPLAVLIDRITEEGVFVSVGAGNTGGSGKGPTQDAISPPYSGSTEHITHEKQGLSTQTASPMLAVVLRLGLSMLHKL